jgi:hypothetical protein
MGRAERSSAAGCLTHRDFRWGGFLEVEGARISTFVFCRPLGDLSEAERRRGFEIRVEERPLGPRTSSKKRTL